MIEIKETLVKDTLDLIEQLFDICDGANLIDSELDTLRGLVKPKELIVNKLLRCLDQV